MKYLLTFLLLINITFAQQDIEKQVVSGLENIYNFKWQNAESDFKQIINKYPEDPRGYHYMSDIYMWYYLSSYSRSDYDAFVRYSDIALDKAEKFLNDNPRNDLMLYVLGSIYSYRALVFGRADKFVDAGWAIKKSEKNLKECLDVNPKRSDAYLGLGLYNLAVSQIPSGFQWVLSLVGLSGDKNIGIKYIKKASAEGYLARTEALFYLFQVYNNVIFDYDNALPIIKQLNQKYPDNLFFVYNNAVLDIKRKNLSSAEKLLFNVINNNKSSVKQLTVLSYFLLGDVHFKNNDFSEAIKFYKLFTQNTGSPEYKGIANYRMAISYEITGNRSEAVKYFYASNKGSSKIDDDNFAKRRGKIYSKRTMSNSEILQIKAANLKEQGKYQIAIDSLLPLFRNVKSEPLKAEAALNIAEAYFMQKDYNNCIKYANLVKQLNIYEEKWIKPFAEYYIARSYRSLGNYKEADKAINNCEDFSDFDYSLMLKSLIFAYKS